MSTNGIGNSVPLPQPAEQPAESSPASTTSVSGRQRPALPIVRGNTPTAVGRTAVLTRQKGKPVLQSALAPTLPQSPRQTASASAQALHVLEKAPPTQLSPFNNLPLEINEQIAALCTFEENKALRLTNHSLHKAATATITKIKIPTSELNSLAKMLKELPKINSVTVTGFEQNADEKLAQLAALDPVHRAKICKLSLNINGMPYGYTGGITDVGLAHLEKFPKLQSLSFALCKNITNIGLASLRNLEQLQSLKLVYCGQITFAVLAHLQKLGEHLISTVIDFSPLISPTVSS